MERDYSAFRWMKTNAPTASSRTDDIWFLDENLGWAVNSNGQILKTEDGFRSCVEQAHFPNVYLRCVAFANSRIGWVGSVATETPEDRLFYTDDGGDTWGRVMNLPANAPQRICGLYAIDEHTVVASGTNYPNEPAGFLKTTDAGKTWTTLALKSMAALLVDIYFRDKNEGWIVGGEDVVRHPGRQPLRDDVIPVVLHTRDGGSTWENQLAHMRPQFPRGEWGWKIQETSDGTMFVSLENFRDGAVLRSDDRGRTWRRLRINDRQRNSNLEGVGFVNGKQGWVGGWGDLNFGGGFTSRTLDGGKTWDDANEVGYRLNRFRFLGVPPRVGFASGDTIYKYSDEVVRREVAFVQPSARRVEGRSMSIRYLVPEGTRELTVDAWERFGRHVGRLLSEQNPAPGERELSGELIVATTEAQPLEEYIVRITTDGSSVSHFVQSDPNASANSA